MAAEQRERAEHVCDRPKPTTSDRGDGRKSD
jgi:hypothetical protein